MADPVVFTTWAAYKTEVLNALANVKGGQILLSSVSPMGPDGTAHTFRSLAELEKHVDWVGAKVTEENAATTGRGRILYMGGVR